MHPPLDRPHPECQDVIAAIKACHANTWKKFTGGCNSIKVALDECLKYEKERLMEDLNKDLKERRLKEEDMIKDAFDKDMTFQEYLQRDKDYQKAMEKKRNRGQ